LVIKLEFTILLLLERLSKIISNLQTTGSPAKIQNSASLIRFILILLIDAFFTFIRYLGNIRIFYK
jgi:hypothetical protein